MLQGEHTAILSTFIKQPFVIKIFIFEWPVYTGFSVNIKNIDENACMVILIATGSESIIYCFSSTLIRSSVLIILFFYQILCRILTPSAWIFLCYILLTIFSSPEPLAHGELL